LEVRTSSIPLTAAKLGDALLTAETFKNNPDLFLG
jgi:hypothetical protein